MRLNGRVWNFLRIEFLVSGATAARHDWTVMMARKHRYTQHTLKGKWCCVVQCHATANAVKKHGEVFVLLNSRENPKKVFRESSAFRSNYQLPELLASWQVYPYAEYFKLPA
jgi:hypothetical protein